MKLSDVELLYEANLISSQQRQGIIDHFQLSHSPNRFLAVVVMIGAVLAAIGVVLIISANWNVIPRFLKILIGAALLSVCHFAGWRLAGKGNHPKLGEMFHFIGACLFLANIGLIGQIYNVSYRSPNFLIVWLLGIAPFVVVLRSLSIHVLSILGFFIWIGMEMNASDGIFQYGFNAGQFGVYAAIGILMYGAGGLFKCKSWEFLSAPTEALGLMFAHLSFWPMLLISSDSAEFISIFFMVIPGLLGCVMVWGRVRQDKEITLQWNIAWVAVVFTWMVLVAFWMLVDRESFSFNILGRMSPIQIIMAIALITGSIIQIRIAEESRKPWMLNLAICTICFCILVIFFLLIGSMMNTGVLFIGGGAGLLGLGYWLEKKRRTVMQRMKGMIVP